MNDGAKYPMQKYGKKLSNLILKNPIEGPLGTSWSTTINKVVAL